MGCNFIEKRPMGWDGMEIFEKYPILWDEKFFKSIPSHGMKNF
jgi:hypothetical protein